MQQDDDRNLMREIDRARLAKEVVENPMFAEAFDRLSAQMRDEWEASPARDTEGRERLWLAVNLLGKVRSHLLETMQTGQMARMQLEEKRSRWQAMKESAMRKWS